jgi:hypothetical protein
MLSASRIVRNLSRTQQQHTVVLLSRGFAAKRKRQDDDPFRVLGVSRKDPFSKVKESFIKIAMSHHPDTHGAVSEEEKNEYRNVFIRARKAFELLAEGPDGEILLKKEKKDMENFDAWFRHETGHDTPFQFMDAKTMKEVAEMEDTIGHGLDRDGGMWMLASMVSKAVKDGQNSAALLQLEAGNVEQKDSSVDGVLRRKRRARR